MDPGWKPAAKQFWRGVIPMVNAKNAAGTSALTVSRAIVLGTLASWIVFGVVLSLLGAEGETDPAIVAIVVVAVGTLDIALLSWLRNRPTKTEGAEALLASYQQSFFIGYAISESSVLWGFIGYFLTGEFWIYLLGIPFGLAGFALTAPTAANLRRMKDRIRATGSPLSLLEVLSRPFPQPPSGPGPG